jgi:hypothetical protein
MKKRNFIKLLAVLLVNGWTKHINNNSGAVTWDVPLSNDEIIQPGFYKQIKALSESINQSSQ